MDILNIGDQEVCFTSTTIPGFGIENFRWVSPVKDSYFFLINDCERTVKKVYVVDGGTVSSVDLYFIDSKETATQQEIFQDGFKLIDAMGLRRALL